MVIDTATAIEYLAVLFGILCVVLGTRESIWTWPTGLIACGLYTWVFYQSKLYGDAWLQVFFIVMNIHGWYSWTHGKSGQQLKITRLGLKFGVIYTVAITAGGLALGYFLDLHSDSDVPYWDSFTTAVSVGGQFLMNRKKLESWIVWLAVDAVYVYVYFIKALYPTALLYLLYLFIAAYGFWEWNSREVRSKKGVGG